MTPEDLAALCAKAPESVALAIRTQQWAETHPDAPNLCNNPGFEETKAGGPPPEGIEWVSTDAPAAWVRTARPEQSQAKLGVRWKDPKGAWNANVSDRFAIAPAGLEGWRKLSVVVTVPDEAGYAVLLAGAVDQQASDAVWFDDLRFVKLPDEARKQRAVTRCVPNVAPVDGGDPGCQRLDAVQR